MEIMTKEQYFEKIAENALHELIDLDMKVNTLIHGQGASEPFTRDELEKWLDVHDNDELDDLWQGDLDTAYDDYMKLNEKDHIFDVEFRFTVSGTAQVHAKDLDEAETYVDENLCINPEVNFYDDDKVVADVEMHDWDEEREYDVNDTDEEYED